MKNQQDYIPLTVTGSSRTRQNPSSSSSSSPNGRAPAWRGRRNGQQNETEFPNLRTNMEGSLGRSSEYHRECIIVIIDDALALIDDRSVSIEQEQQEEQPPFSGGEEDSCSPGGPAGFPN